MSRFWGRKVGSGSRGVKTGDFSTFGIAILAVIVGLFLMAQSSMITAANAPAKPDERKIPAEKAEGKKGKVDANPEAKPDGKKAAELAEREEALKREEERIKIMKKEIDDKIDRYSKLLDKLEETLKMVDAAKNEKMGHVIKAYEIMPNEEAAARLSVLDEQTAVKILINMKSKKAGSIMAAMDPKKAAALTESMLNIAKKFPPK